MYGPGDAATWPACSGHPNDPRTEVDDDVMTEDQALEIAADALVRTPYAVAWWLQEEADKAGVIEIDAAAVTDHMPDASVSELLALIMDGRPEEIVAAAHELRDRFKASQANEIKSAARDILREHGHH